MYQTTIDITEIRQCQKELQFILTEILTENGEFNIGFPRGSWLKNINLDSNIGYFSFDIGNEEKSPRFWNGFGLSSELNDKKSNRIVLENNIPKTLINTRVAGLFAKGP
jgi:5-methylcytosine-specific restriction protein A